jgi:hypothetical protein
MEIVPSPTQYPTNHLIKNQPINTEKVFIPKLSPFIKRPIESPQKLFSQNPSSNLT